MSIYQAYKAQIVLLVAKNVIIPAKYLDYLNILSKKSAIELPNHFKINKYLIDVESDKQPFYGSIYSLKLIELKILKTYIKINLVNGFI